MSVYFQHSPVVPEELDEDPRMKVQELQEENIMLRSQVSPILKIFTFNNIKSTPL